MRFREIRTREKIERNLGFDPDKRIVPGQAQNEDWVPPKNIPIEPEEDWVPPKNIPIEPEEDWVPPKNIPIEPEED